MPVSITSKRENVRARFRTGCPAPSRRCTVQSELHLTSCRELQRIRQQVLEHLLETFVSVCMVFGSVGVELHRKVEPFAVRDVTEGRGQ